MIESIAWNLGLFVLGNTSISLRDMGHFLHQLLDCTPAASAKYPMNVSFRFNPHEQEKPIPRDPITLSNDQQGI